MVSDLMYLPIYLIRLLTWGATNRDTDNGHPERAFFQKFETFGLEQTNWAEIL